MKKLIFIFLVSVMLSCSEDNEFNVGVRSDAVEDIANVALTMTTPAGDLTGVTTDALRGLWESQLKKELGRTVKLTSFEILKSEEDSATFFFLKTVSSDGEIETGSFLDTSGDGSYTIRAKTCTCSGCPNGCRLIVTGSLCSCSSCAFNEGTCTKTETQTISE